VNEHFVDADGNATTSTAAITTLMPLLSYQYESSAIGSNAATPAITSTTEYQRIEKRLREGANVKFDIRQRVRLAERASVSLARPFSAQTRLTPQDFSRIINADTAQERVFASIEYARLPASSDFSVRVFVNLPNANPGTPTSDPHYAGSFGFFGTSAANAAGAHQHQPTFLVNLTNTIQRLKRNQELKDTDPLSMQLVVVPFSGTLENADTQLALEGLDIVTTPVIVNPSPQ
jgi:tyrosinase